MTPEEHLKRAKDGLWGADRRKPPSADWSALDRELKELHQVQAHALVGILEHLVSRPQFVYGDTEQEARAKAEKLALSNIPPPTSAKMRRCTGCGTDHPLTAFAGRLVEHWDPATLSDVLGPVICDQRAD